ncbi:MAG: universal stress protein [Hyphomicrobiaceae bacterium]|nr:universal stress protein [Hyphomicrobiaceae bacterium]
MPTQRRAHEAGHRRKFLVVVDQSPELDRALYYAARRAERTGGGVVLLYTVEDQDFRGFLGVEKVMRAEARALAEQTLAQVAERARGIANVEPELVIREGNRAESVMRLIDDDEDIAVLVLAAGTGSEGPGPLVTSLAGRASATFPIPITIVPGHLSDEDIAAVA